MNSLALGPVLFLWMRLSDFRWEISRLLGAQQAGGTMRNWEILTTSQGAETCMCSC